MKKINLLAIAVLFCQQVGATNLSGATWAQTSSIPSQTYTVSLVDATGAEISKISFSLNGSTSVLSDIVTKFQSLSYLFGSQTVPTLYVYKADGTPVAQLSALTSINSSWLPSAADTVSFYISPSNTLTQTQLAAAAGTGAESALVSGAVESQGGIVQTPTDPAAAGVAEGLAEAVARAAA